MFVEVLPGHRTPVQLVKSEHAFVEVPFEGRFLFLHVDKKDAFTIRYFDGNSQRRGGRGGEVFNEAEQGELMSWYCLDDLPQNEIGKIVEYETPGFDSAELPTVTPESEELEGRNVPQEFWNATELIDSGSGIELLNSHK